MMLCYSFNNFQESNAINLKNAVTVIVYTDINSSTIVQCQKFSRKRFQMDILEWLNWHLTCDNPLSMPMLTGGHET